jgi:hypothetical protein
MTQDGGFSRVRARSLPHPVQKAIPSIYPDRNASLDLEVRLDALSRTERDTLAEAITDKCVKLGIPRS